MKTNLCLKESCPDCGSEMYWFEKSYRGTPDELYPDFIGLCSGCTYEFRSVDQMLKLRRLGNAFYSINCG
jgi:hypothetical protein